MLINNKEPATKVAYLPSAGLNYRTATKHVYSHSQFISLPCKPHETPITGIEHLFKCDVTGELRRWGFDAFSN